MPATLTNQQIWTMVVRDSERNQQLTFTEFQTVTDRGSNVEMTERYFDVATAAIREDVASTSYNDLTFTIAYDGNLPKLVRLHELLQQAKRQKTQIPVEVAYRLGKTAKPTALVNALIKTFSLSGMNTLTNAPTLLTINVGYSDER